MKQHITYKEFYDLEETKKEKLLLAIGRKDLLLIDFGTNHELFTISKMIEILGNDLDTIHLDANGQYNLMYQDKKSEWCKQLVATELIDILFVAVNEMILWSNV